MRKYLLFIAVIALIIPSLIACRAEPLDPEQPNVVLLSPGNGSTFKSGDIQVRLYLEHFVLNKDNSQPNKVGEGRIIYYLDAMVPMSQGNSATTKTGSFVSTESSYTWLNVEPGQHIFTVQLVNNDNTPLIPPVAVWSNVTVR